MERKKNEQSELNNRTIQMKMPALFSPTGVGSCINAKSIFSRGHKKVNKFIDPHFSNQLNTARCK